MSRIIYPSKVWRRQPEQPPRADPVDLARDVDTRRLWPILDAIEGPGFLTADHVGLLLYQGVSRATKAASGQLKRLLDMGVVDALRFGRQGAKGRGGSSPLVYCLTRAGAKVLALNRGVPVTDVKWTDEQRALSTFTIAHRLNEADFHVALAAFCDDPANNARLIRFEYEPRFDMGKAGTLAPDLLAEVAVPGGTLSLTVEVDRGSERPKRFAEKTTRYEHFYLSGEWERWLESPPTVLVVAMVGDAERVEALRVATRGALRTASAKFRRYRFTTGDWLYRVERSRNGYAAPVEVAFSEAHCLNVDNDEWLSLLGGGGGG